jgi:hypothetical protein
VRYGFPHSENKATSHEGDASKYGHDDGYETEPPTDKKTKTPEVFSE